MSNTTIKVLFDNNIYADISENRRDSAKHLDVIEKAIAKGIIIIPVSMEIINEIALISHSNRDKFERRWSLLYKLVDWNYCLKVATDLLNDEIKSFAKKGVQTNPFINKEYHLYKIINEFSDMVDPPSNDVLEEFANSEYDSKGAFQDIFNIFGDQWQNHIVSPSGFTFQQWWGNLLDEPRLDKSFPKKLLFHLADSINRGYTCRSRGIENLLNYPTILLPMGFWTRSAYDQIVNKRREKPGVGYDFKHTIHAGAIGQIVTGDKVLLRTLREIPGHDVKAFTLDEFIDTINDLV